jgi:Domain of unknown function (DUF4396)
MNHDHHHHQPVKASGDTLQHMGAQAQSTTRSSRKEPMMLALSATFHCLIGCGIGEVTGMIISMAIGLDITSSIILSVTLGFVAGLALGVWPLLRYGFTFRNALNTVIIGEGLSIVVMEAFEVGTQLYIPGVMTAHLTDGIFWWGMLASLGAGFIAALPVNYFFVKRGIRHQH